MVFGIDNNFCGSWLLYELWDMNNKWKDNYICVGTIENTDRFGSNLCTDIDITNWVFYYK